MRASHSLLFAIWVTRRYDLTPPQATDGRLPPGL